MANAYLGKLGASADEIAIQIERLLQLNGAAAATRPLLAVETRLDDPLWDKSYFEPVRADLLAAVPAEARRILSVGCGSGATEVALQARGASVTVIPLDSVMSAVARAKGLRALSPDYAQARGEIANEDFDVILWPDVLQLDADPRRRLQEFLPVLRPGGAMVVSVPNCLYTRTFRGLLAGDPQLRQLCCGDSYAAVGLQFTSPRVVRRWLANAGLRVGRDWTRRDEEYQRLGRATLGLMDHCLAHRVVQTGVRADG